MNFEAFKEKQKEAVQYSAYEQFCKSLGPQRESKEVGLHLLVDAITRYSTVEGYESVGTFTYYLQNVFVVYNYIYLYVYIYINIANNLKNSK